MAGERVDRTERESSQRRAHRWDGRIAAEGPCLAAAAAVGRSVSVHAAAGAHDKNRIDGTRHVLAVAERAEAVVPVGRRGSRQRDHREQGAADQTP